MREVTLRTSLARALLARHGYTNEVEQAYIGALAQFEEEQEPPELLPILRGLASFYNLRGEFAKGAHVGREILRLAEAQEDASMRVDGHLVLGSSLAMHYDLRGGLDHLDKAIACFEAQHKPVRRFGLGNNPGVAALTTSALTLWMLGYPDRALVRANRAVALATDLEHPFTLAYTLFHTGFLHLWRREPELARDRAVSALDIADEHDLRIWMALGSCLLAARTPLARVTTRREARMTDNTDMCHNVRASTAAAAEWSASAVTNGHKSATASRWPGQHTPDSSVGLRPASASPNRPVKLRILFLVSAHNGLSQRALIALSELGHEVAVRAVDSAGAMEAAVQEHDPELIVCPFLKTVIPESIWAKYRCLIVHPGPKGDRGPSSLDWAIELEAPTWGVTVLEADGELDAGEVWATRSFPMRKAGKSSLYRHEVRHAAIEALIEATGKIAARGAVADAPDSDPTAVTGRARPLMTQDFRAIDWDSDCTDTVLRKIRAGEGHPGVLDSIHGTEFHLFGAHRERMLRGRAGELIAQRDGAICRATVDGAIWITHLKRRDTPTRRYFKLPSVCALALGDLDPDLPESSVAVHEPLPADHTYREIVYEERAAVGYLHFDFYNGAMSTDQCRSASSAPTPVTTTRGGDRRHLYKGQAYPAGLRPK